MEEYDAELAQAVLVTLNKTFPRPLTNMQLKQALKVEPSDEALLSILEGLQIEGLITGKGLHENTTSHRRLVVMANVQLTAEGRKQASGRSTQPEQASIVHQYISHAPVGAMGPNSTGTINYYQQWQAIAKTVDLSVVALQLEQLRVELQKTATSREDHKQLGQIADAEEHAEKKDGPKVLSILSAAGTTILTAATKIGADEVLKLLAEHWKH